MIQSERFPHLTFGERAQLVLEGRDVGDVAVGSGQEIGDGGLQAGAGDVAVRIDETRQQSLVGQQVVHPCVRPLPLGPRLGQVADEDDPAVLDRHRLGRRRLLVDNRHDGTAGEDDVGISRPRSRRDFLGHHTPPVLL